MKFPLISSLLIFVIVLSACNQSKTKNKSEDTFVPDSNAVSSREYLDVLEQSLTSLFNTANIPLGRISPGKLGGQPVEPLRIFEKSGIINIKKIDQEKEHREKYASSTALVKPILVILGDEYEISPTEKTNRSNSVIISDDANLIVKLAKCHVESIIEEKKYTNARLSSSDDFILVVGTYSALPTDLITGDPSNFKFRAILQKNPFNQKYSFIRGDWGFIQEAGWKTNNVW